MPSRRFSPALAAVGLLFLALPARADGDPKKPETLGTIERLDPKFDDLVPKGAVIEVLAGGFKWSEGPVWVKDGNYLLFSDIPNNRVCKWSAKDGLQADYLKPSGFTAGAKFDGREPGSNGLAIDKAGHLILCQHGDRRIARRAADGKFVTLADKYMGKRFNSPNDLVYAANGDLYFTDPPYGLPKGMDDPAKELDFQGVYRLKPSGEVTLLTKEMSRPNGIGLTPDGKTLIVANSDGANPIWKAFPVKPDGTLGEGKVFADATAGVKAKKPGGPDGFKIDAKGNLFATGPGGVWVMDAAGKHLGTIATGVPTANCAFGDDGSTLYITANDKLVRVRTTAKGQGF
jgi:gluconolactonase